jgi:DNA-binding SARP family transcriptional activator
MQIRLLGDVEVRLGPIALEAFASPRLQSLLAFLIVHRDRPLARQRVAFIFWPDSSESQARTNLRHLLHMLRQALVEPDRYVSIDGQTVQWLPDASASIDVVDFEHAISAVDSGDEAESLRRALVHYGGDFLLGSYDDWVEPERQRLRRRYVWALDRLAAIAEETSDLDAGLRYAQELLRIDPCDEPTCRRLMRLHIAAGDRARALHAYHACESALAHDLGVTPSPDTVTLYEGLVADGTGSTASSVPAAISTPCDMTSSISLHPQHQDEHLTGRSYRAGQVRRRRAGREEWTISIHSAIVLDRPFRKRSDDPGTRWQQGDPIEGANRHRARAARRRSWARFPLRAASASHRQRLALAGRSWNGVWRGWPGSLGSPRPRSPMMFRWISSVPP